MSGTPSAFDMDEEDEYEDDFVTIPKEKYDSMIEDLLTMAELIDMVSDMRTKDVPLFCCFQHLYGIIPEHKAFILRLFKAALPFSPVKQRSCIVFIAESVWEIWRYHSHYIVCYALRKHFIFHSVTTSMFNYHGKILSLDNFILQFFL